MTKREWLILAGVLLGFLALGALVYLPTTQSRLRKAAHEALAAENADRFRGVEVQFKGQHAVLTGQVDSERDIEEAERIVADLRVPTLFGSAKPKAVSGVRNLLTVGPVGSTPGGVGPPQGSEPFVSVTRFGDTVQLDGRLGSDALRQSLVDDLGQRYPGARVIDRVDVSNRVGPAPRGVDFDGLPAASEGSFFAAGKLDGAWTSFPGDASEEEIVAGLERDFPGLDSPLGGLSALRSWQEANSGSAGPPPANTNAAAAASTNNLAATATNDAATATNAPPAPDRPERRSVIGRLTFEPNAARASDEQLAYVLNLVREVQRRQPRAHFLLVGHTDSKGGEDTNRRVSASRAQVVVDYLVANGVDPGHLRAEGRGESEPIGDNETAEGRAKNRRVEVIWRINPTLP